MLLNAEIDKMLRSNGVYDVGFCRVPDSPCGLHYAVSIVAALSDAVVDEITDAPTHTYFHHYRTVNAFIDAFFGDGRARFMDIGRGAVCGICVKVCPKGIRT